MDDDDPAVPQAVDVGALSAPTGIAKILVVDDDEGNLVALRSILAQLGQPIVTCRSGLEALRALLHQDFAVILLDVRMPDMDGYETAELIRARSRSRHVPIIFLSGVDKDEAHLFRGYAAGAVDYVFKPVEPVILRSKVSVFVELHRKAEQERCLLAENLEVRTRQIETAAALERSLMQQSLVIDTLPVALFVASPENGYRTRRFVGGNVQQLLGLDEGQLAGSEIDWLEHVHEADRERVAESWAGAGERGGIDIEYRFLRAQGFCWLMERASLRPSADGGNTELLGLVSDISARKRLEEQLTHAQKMEAVGQMSGAIAHDFNNMLSVIIGGLDRISNSAEFDARTTRRLDLAMQAAKSCADLTKQLLGFARRQALDPRQLSLEEEIARLAGLFERVLGETIVTDIACPKDLWPVWLDSSQFEAALVNIVVNARDAMPDGGKLAITGENISLDAAAATELAVPAGDYVRLEVSDSGIGMDEETMAHALEPFYTTKSAGEGTGLGLSSIEDFLRQSGGALRLESTVGEGTSIHLFLPRSTQKGLTRRAVRPQAASRKFDGLSVLVVEDDPQVREVASEMLRTLGCDVTAARSGDDAAARLDTFDDIEVLFTDCVMPGEIDGPRLAEIMSGRKQDLAVVLTSGFRGSTRPMPAGGRTAFLPKPYTHDQLADTLAGLAAD